MAIKLLSKCNVIVNIQYNNKSILLWVWEKESGKINSDMKFFIHDSDGAKPVEYYNIYHRKKLFQYLKKMSPTSRRHNFSYF